MTNLPQINLGDVGLQIESKLSKSDLINLVIDSLGEEFQTTYDEAKEDFDKALEALRVDILEKSKKEKELLEKHLNNTQALNIPLTFGEGSKTVGRHVDLFDVDFVVHVTYYGQNDYNPGVHVRIGYDSPSQHLREFQIEYRISESCKKPSWKAFVKARDALVKAEEDLQTYHNSKTTMKNQVIKGILASTKQGQNILNSVDSMVKQARSNIKQLSSN